MKPRIFQLIDLDRTLFDTSLFVKAITDEINKTEPGVGTKLDELFEAAYTSDETFFLLRHLRQEHGDAAFEALVARVVEVLGADALILDGVTARLAEVDELSSYQPAWGILTYGDDIDQRMKTRLIGMQDAPLLVAQTPDKSELIRSWQMPDGTFQLPQVFGGGVVDCVTLEDDKLRAFNGLPKGAFGFWITSNPQAGVMLAEGIHAGIPATVRAIKDVSHATEFIQKML